MGLAPSTSSKRLFVAFGVSSVAYVSFVGVLNSKEGLGDLGGTNQIQSKRFEDTYCVGVASPISEASGGILFNLVNDSVYAEWQINLTRLVFSMLADRLL